jgi:hypothetical protein
LIRQTLAVVVVVTGALAVTAASELAAQRGQPAPSAAASGTRAGAPDQAVINQFCVGCHNDRLKTGSLSLEGLDVTRPADHPEIWEKAVRKLRGGLMPPPDRPRPDAAKYAALLSSLQDRLDAADALHPNPGRTDTVHRLNRLEYENAVRDILGVEIDGADLLPADDSSYGFDNIAGVLKTSPALLERYLSVARIVSRAAVGSPPPAIDAVIHRISPDTQQHDRGVDLPFGTRGGTLVRLVFPQTAEYEIKVAVGGGGRGNAAGSPQVLEITLDGVPVKTGPAGGRDTPGGRITVSGGPHDIGVAFLRKPPDLVEQVREPFQNPSANGSSGPAGPMPTVTSVTITGPYNATGAGDTPSRRRIFTCTPKDPGREATCARTILAELARRAYRGTVSPDSLKVLIDFYESGRAEGGSFEQGIELAIRRMLISPEFLYRVEADPAPRAGRAGAATSYRIPDLDLASRLSFFLWSSVPDDELLKLAARGTLHEPAALERQVRRMLADPRSDSFTTNFTGQWLMLRNLETARPVVPLSLNFDNSLRQSMQRETELLFQAVVRENRSVLELLDADFTFLNERLARHYGIPHVMGSHFRRVALPADSPRRGLLGHGSVLTVTSYANRTSPVIRGKWILNNILGTPPPDPPPNVPALPDRMTQARVKTMRERMAQHRENPACTSCHVMMDPAGLALENFDAIGRWRTVDESFNRIDASGTLPDGTRFDGVVQLRAALLGHPERFVNTVTEKLMTYALGRGLEYYDMPAVRKIVRDTAAAKYPMEALIAGVVTSRPFQFRSTRQN